MKLKQNKKLILALVLSMVLILLYVLGPKPATVSLDPILPQRSLSLALLEKEIIARESSIKSIKAGNQSRIVWNDSILKNKTPYCIVYLHGFSASPQEGSPVHVDISRKFGCNLYLPRLYAHGLNEKEPLLELTEENYLNAAKEAVAEAKNLGEKVIIMGTSTGCTFALYIASGNPDIAGLILYSPNIDLFDARSVVLLQPWGLELARLLAGGNYYSFKGPAGMEQYWTATYRIEALIKMKDLLRNTMKPSVFQKIKQPTLVCYYYKNDAAQDSVVSVPAILKMYDELGTPENLKRKVAIPNAGNHAIASDIWSHDVNSVEKETADFMEKVLMLKPLF